MGKRILVPLDGSHRADAALRHLPAVCEPGDEVTLLSVARPGSRQQVGTRPTRAVTSWANSAGAVRLVTGGDTPVFETKEQARERQVVTLTSYLNAYADEVQARCKGKIASFKIPRHVVQVESLPMTASGKVQRVFLRERAARELVPQVLAKTG